MKSKSIPIIGILHDALLQVQYAATCVRTRWQGIGTQTSERKRQLLMTNRIPELRLFISVDAADREDFRALPLL